MNWWIDSLIMYLFVCLLFVCLWLCPPPAWMTVLCNEDLCWTQCQNQCLEVDHNEKAWTGVVISVEWLAKCSCIYFPHHRPHLPFVLRSVLQACCSLSGSSFISLPSVWICLIAPSSPCHLTVISTNNINMDFPAETGFKRHVSARFDIKRDLSEDLSIFLSVKWGWQPFTPVLPPSCLCDPGLSSLAGNH